MAEELRRKHMRQLLEKRRSQLPIEVWSDDDSTLPDAQIIYHALTEQLGLSKDPSSQHVKAIYKPDPNTPWRWSLLFESESLKNTFEGKETNLLWTNHTDNSKHTYYFRTGKTQKSLLITMHSSPLIENDELQSFFEQYEVVQSTVHKPHHFAEHIDSSLRMFSCVYMKM